MTDIAEFNRLINELKQKKNYRKDELGPVHEALAGLQVDESAVDAVCRGLSKLQWQDAVALLAGKWSDLPPKQRLAFVRWRWHEKGKDAVISACVAMAAAINTIDMASAGSFLAAGINSARFGPSGRQHLLRSLRKWWIEANGRDTRSRLEELTWEKMETAYRWDFIEGCVDAAATGTSDGVAKSSITDPRKTIALWLTSMAQSLPAGSSDLKRLEDLAQRLTRTAVGRPSDPAVTAPTAITPAVNSEPSSATGRAESGEGAENADAPVSEFDRVVTAANRAHQAIESLLTESHRRGQGAAKEVAALQLRLQEAIEGRKIAEADAGQFRRDADSERARAASLQAQVAECREELKQDREQIALLEGRLEAIQEELKVKSAKVTELTNSLADDRRKYMAILDTERQEARRVFGEQIAHAILPDVEHLREVEKDPPSADQAKFLRVLMGAMFKRLQALDVAIQG